MLAIKVISKKKKYQALLKSRRFYMMPQKISRNRGNFNEHVLMKFYKDDEGRNFMKIMK